MLLYSAYGANWTYGSRITYSFVPDGTNIAGQSSQLFSTLNAKYSTATWEAQFQKAAASWETYANINLSQVSDDGAPLGSGLYQQGDPNMGDIRISMVPLSNSNLAITFMPAPINGGSDAGDIIFNSNVNWQINSGYDIMTVAMHEFGHALGLGESSVSTAVMYADYTGIKQSLTADDIAGIQSIDGAPKPDIFDSGPTSNNSYTTATNINSYISSTGQIALSGLNLNSTSDTDWYYVTAPSTTNGTITVTMQSSNLSSLSPKVVLYNSSLVGLAQATAPSTFGATVSVTINGVTPGESFYIHALAASAPCAIGAYGLLVNFGSSPQSPIAPPDTQVLDQPNQGGGTDNLFAGSTPPMTLNNWNLNSPDLGWFQIGRDTSWGFGFGAPSNATNTTNGQTTSDSTIGSSAYAQGLTSLGSTTGSNVTSSIQLSTSSLLGSSSSSQAPAATSAVVTTPVTQVIDQALGILAADAPGSILGEDDDSVGV